MVLSNCSIILRACVQQDLVFRLWPNRNPVLCFLQVSVNQEPRPISCSLKRDQGSNEEDYYQVFLLLCVLGDLAMS